MSRLHRTDAHVLATGRRTPSCPPERRSRGRPDPHQSKLAMKVRRSITLPRTLVLAALASSASGRIERGQPLSHTFADAFDCKAKIGDTSYDLSAVRRLPLPFLSVQIKLTSRDLQLTSTPLNVRAMPDTRRGLA